MPASRTSWTEDNSLTLTSLRSLRTYYTFGILGMEDDDIYAQADSIVKAHAVKGLNAPYQAGFYYLDANLKFFVTDQPGVSYLPFIRSSEMVLIEAEANYFLHHEAEAQAALVELMLLLVVTQNIPAPRLERSFFQRFRTIVVLSFGVRASSGATSSVGTRL